MWSGPSARTTSGSTIGSTTSTAAKRNGKVRVLPPGGSADGPEDDGDATDTVAEQLRFNLELDDRIASKLVDMAGDKKMWPTWGKRAAGIANAIRVKIDDALTANPRPNRRLCQIHRRHERCRR